MILQHNATYRECAHPNAGTKRQLLTPKKQTKIHRAHLTWLSEINHQCFIVRDVRISLLFGNSSTAKPIGRVYSLVVLTRTQSLRGRKEPPVFHQTFACLLFVALLSSALCGCEKEDAHADHGTLQKWEQLRCDGFTAFLTGHSELALKDYLQALAIANQSRMNELAIAQASEDCADACVALGKSEDAEKYYRQAISVYEQLPYNSDSNFRGIAMELAKCLVNLANVLPENHQSEANHLYERALKLTSPYDLLHARIQREFQNSLSGSEIAQQPEPQGTPQPNTGQAREEMIKRWTARFIACREKAYTKDYDAALPLSKSLLATALSEQQLPVERALIDFGIPSTHVLYALDNLADVYDHLENDTEAEKALLASEKIRQQYLWPEHRDSIAGHCNLLSLYIERDQYPQANEQANALIQCHAPLTDLNTTVLNAGLAAIYANEHRWHDADLFLSKSMRFVQQGKTEIRQDFLHAWLATGDSFLRAGMSSKALALFQSMLDVQKEAQVRRNARAAAISDEDKERFESWIQSTNQKVRQAQSACEEEQKFKKQGNVKVDKKSSIGPSSLQSRSTRKAA